MPSPTTTASTSYTTLRDVTSQHISTPRQRGRRSLGNRSLASSTGGFPMRPFTKRLAETDSYCLQSLISQIRGFIKYLISSASPKKACALPEHHHGIGGGLIQLEYQLKVLVFSQVLIHADNANRRVGGPAARVRKFECVFQRRPSLLKRSMLNTQ